MKNTGKTNVMRVLDSLKIPYVSHFYEEDASLSGVDVARLLGSWGRKSTGCSRRW